jgi:hypothetical protein
MDHPAARGHLEQVVPPLSGWEARLVPSSAERFRRRAAEWILAAVLAFFVPMLWAFLFFQQRSPFSRFAAELVDAGIDILGSRAYLQYMEWLAIPAAVLLLALAGAVFLWLHPKRLFRGIPELVLFYADRIEAFGLGSRVALPVSIEPPVSDPPARRRRPAGLIVCLFRWPDGTPGTLPLPSIWFWRLEAPDGSRIKKASRFVLNRYGRRVSPKRHVWSEISNQLFQGLLIGLLSIIQVSLMVCSIGIPLGPLMVLERLADHKRAAQILSLIPEHPFFAVGLCNRALRAMETDRSVRLEDYERFLTECAAAGQDDLVVRVDQAVLLLGRGKPRLAAALLSPEATGLGVRVQLALGRPAQARAVAARLSDSRLRHYYTALSLNEEGRPADTEEALEAETGGLPRWEVAYANLDCAAGVPLRAQRRLSSRSVEEWIGRRAQAAQFLGPETPTRLNRLLFDDAHVAIALERTDRRRAEILWRRVEDLASRTRLGGLLDSYRKLRRSAELGCRAEPAMAPVS